MMKNKIITVLLLASAGFGQDAQAMGGTRNFAKRVLFSGTAAVATGAGLFSHYKNQTEKDEGLETLETAQCTLPFSLEGKVKKMFKDVGIDAIVKDFEGAGGPAVFQHKDKVFLVLPWTDRWALECGRGHYADGFVTEADILSVIKHERSHAQHKDVQSREIAQCCVIPGGLMAAKMARVAGKTKIGTVVVGLATGILGKALAQQYSQYLENRADHEAIETWEDAENIAHYLEVVFLPSEKRCVMTLDRWFNIIFHTHPLSSERIAYLKERAYVLRTREVEQLVSDLDVMSSAAQYNLETMLEGDFEPFEKKINRIRDIKKSMNDKEKKHWRDIFVKNSTDPICVLIHKDFR